MGRLNKNEQRNERLLFANNVQYTKLKDEQFHYTGSRESLNRVMPGFEGYMSFSCRHCGHLQIFQGAELEMMLGKSLKMAFRSGKKEQQADKSQSSSFEQRHPNLLTKNNVLMMPQEPSYDKPFQETMDGSSIGIPLMSGGLIATRSTPSSEECNSPTQMNQFKRIVEKPSLIKRIGKGFVMNASDEEGYPLVSVSEGSSSVPGSQSNISLLNAEPGCSDTSTLRIDDVDTSKEVTTKNQPKNLFQYSERGVRSEEEAEVRGKINSGLGAFHRKEGNLRMAPWYQEGIPREIALEILSQEPVGSFMVRKSTTKMGCFALSVRVPRSFQPRGIAHYLIMRTNKGYRIKGFTKDFPTLASLIAHHSVMPELLPCPLSLGRYHPVCVVSDCRRDFADIEPEPDG